MFTLSSLLCGLAPSLPLLVFFRVLQGAGGGGMQPAAQAILIDSFPRKKHGSGHGHVRDRRAGGSRHRPDDRRMDHRQLQLALDFSDQHSDRHHFGFSHLVG